METLIQANIFFFISSLATIMFAFLGTIALFYLVKAMRNLYLLSEELKNTFKDSEEFVEELKERLENNPIFRFLFPSSRKRKRTDSK